jgi:hypothetical protein
MSRGKASGYALSQADLAIVLGMQARGDRDHDIAAWFGVNQGRVAEVKEGKYGTVPLVPANKLPPKGAPGVKGRHLRNAVRRALDELTRDVPNVESAIVLLQRGLEAYNMDEA